MSGTRRTPIARSHAPQITAQVISLFRHALKLRRQGSDQETVHAAERNVDRMLGLKLWNDSVFNSWFDTAEGPPDYLLERNADAAERAFWRIKRLREQLLQADRELTRQERAARRTVPAPASPSSSPEEPTPPPSSP